MMSGDIRPILTVDTELLEDSSTEGIAKEICLEVDLAKKAAFSAVEHAVKAGTLLIIARKRIPEGEWVSWLKHDCQLSRAWAWRLMYVAHKFPTLASRDKEKVMQKSIKGAISWLKEEKVMLSQATSKEIEDTSYCQLYACDLLDAPIESDSIDWIITDPPYPREFLPVYDKLGEFAARVLKPQGGLIVMVGQTYQYEIQTALRVHLTYRHLLAYLTPGGQAVQLWEAEYNTFWKPLFHFVKNSYQKNGRWFGDVCKSAVNDNDKRFHDWGQSESGMADVIKRFTLERELVCDPFLGGGTTAVVALELNRRFIGVDIDANAVERVKRRLGVQYAELRSEA